MENIVSHIRLNSENFNAAIINGKLFQLGDIESVLRVHSLKLLKEKVRKETEWLSLERHSTLNYPHDAIVINPTYIEQFRNILHDGQHNVCVEHNRFSCLLYSDLSDLAGSRWTNLSHIGFYIFYGCYG